MIRLPNQEKTTLSSGNNTVKNSLTTSFTPLSFLLLLVLATLFADPAKAQEEGASSSRYAPLQTLLT